MTNKSLNDVCSVVPRISLSPFSPPKNHVSRFARSNPCMFGESSKSKSSNQEVSRKTYSLGSPDDESNKSYNFPQVPKNCGNRKLSKSSFHTRESDLFDSIGERSTSSISDISFESNAEDNLTNHSSFYIPSETRMSFFTKKMRRIRSKKFFGCLKNILFTYKVFTLMCCMFFCFLLLLIIFSIGFYKMILDCTMISASLRSVVVSLLCVLILMIISVCFALCIIPSGGKNAVLVIFFGLLFVVLNTLFHISRDCLFLLFILPIPFCILMLISKSVFFFLMFVFSYVSFTINIPIFYVFYKPEYLGFRNILVSIVGMSFIHYLYIVILFYQEKLSVMRYLLEKFKRSTKDLDFKTLKKKLSFSKLGYAFFSSHKRRKRKRKMQRINARRRKRCVCCCCICYKICDLAKKCFCFIFPFLSLFLFVNDVIEAVKFKIFISYFDRDVCRTVLNTISILEEYKRFLPFTVKSKYLKRRKIRDQLISLEPSIISMASLPQNLKEISREVKLKKLERLKSRKLSMVNSSLVSSELSASKPSSSCGISSKVSRVMSMMENRQDNVRKNNSKNSSAKNSDPVSSSLFLEEESIFKVFENQLFEKYFETKEMSLCYLEVTGLSQLHEIRLTNSELLEFFCGLTEQINQISEKFRGFLHQLTNSKFLIGFNSIIGCQDPEIFAVQFALKSEALIGKKKVRGVSIVTKTSVVTDINICGNIGYKSRNDEFRVYNIIGDSIERLDDIHSRHKKLFGCCRSYVPSTIKNSVIIDESTYLRVKYFYDIVVADLIFHETGESIHTLESFDFLNLPSKTFFFNDGIQKEEEEEDDDDEDSDIDDYIKKTEPNKRFIPGSLSRISDFQVLFQVLRLKGNVEDPVSKAFEKVTVIFNRAFWSYINGQYQECIFNLGLCSVEKKKLKKRPYISSKTIGKEVILDLRNRAELRIERNRRRSLIDDE